VPKEEADLVGDLRYSWRKLKKLAADVSDNLAKVQVRQGAWGGTAAAGQGLELQAACGSCW